MAPGFRCFLALAVVASGAASCKEPYRPDATYNLQAKDDIFDPDVMLTSKEREDLLALMRRTVPETSGLTVGTAEYGVRWSDVDGAVRWGSSIAEMAIWSSTYVPASAQGTSGDGSITVEHWIYEIVTAADDPVTLTVVREPPPRIYSATAVAGLFRDRPDITARLLNEFDQAMKAYGQKPAPQAKGD